MCATRKMLESDHCDDDVIVVVEMAKRGTTKISNDAKSFGFL